MANRIKEMETLQDILVGFSEIEGQVTKSAAGSFGLTRTSNTWRIRIPRRVLEHLGIAADYHQHDAVEVAIRINREKQLLLLLAPGDHQKKYKISGTAEVPIVYSAVIGTEVMKCVGRELRCNKSISFPNMQFQDANGEKFVLIELAQYSCASDALEAEEEPEHETKTDTAVADEEI